jgi:hypothetical protein
MQKRVFYLWFLLVWACGFLVGQERGVELLVKRAGLDVEVGRQYLVLIAIDDYDLWMDLTGPVNDAEGIGSVLEKRYYVDETVRLLDKQATREAIVRLFKDLQQRLKERDSVLIFYAGHGHWDEASNTGYWIPVNAGIDENRMANWLPNQLIKGLIGNFKARHVLLVSDSCYSGDLVTRFRSAPVVIDNVYYEKAYRLKSRQVMTSGSMERVPDSSEFARQLRVALLKNVDVLLDPVSLFVRVRSGVKGSQPLFGELTSLGHQQGASFLLFKKSLPKTSIPLISKKSVPLQQGSNWVRTVQEEFQRVNKIDQDSGATLLRKKRAWEGFLQRLEFDNPHSGVDNHMKAFAGERLRFWNQFKTPEFLSLDRSADVSLRSQCRVIGIEQVRNMLRTKEFFCANHGINQDYSNPDGNFKGRLAFGDKVVVDSSTGLMWDRSGSPHAMGFADVGGWVAMMNKYKYGGYSDWRLPTAEEAASLLRRGKNQHGLFIDGIFSEVQFKIWTCDSFKSQGQPIRWAAHFGMGYLSLETGVGPFVRVVRPIR